MRCILLTMVLSLVPVAGAAQDPLQTLVPLMEVFTADGDTPGFDVVGIRCAGLYYAQQTWRQQNGGNGPTRAQLEVGEISLRRTVQHRINAGMDIVSADQSTEADLRRVMDLYLARFAQNAASGHPWRNDSTLGGDLDYCSFAAG
jgi:hypothetical protein